MREVPRQVHFRHVEPVDLAVACAGPRSVVLAHSDVGRRQYAAAAAERTEGVDPHLLVVLESEVPAKMVADLHLHTVGHVGQV